MSRSCFASLLPVLIGSACSTGELGRDDLEAELAGDAATDVDAIARSAARCGVSPSTPMIGQTYVVTADRLARNEPARFEISDASGMWRVDGVADRTGRMRTTLQATMVGPGLVQVFSSTTSGAPPVATCRFTVIDGCGNGVCGAAESCASCAADCGACPACGDGVVNVGEECDDGNLVANDGCSTTCFVEVAPECRGDGDCDDQVGCTVDACLPDGTCSHVAGSIPCGEASRELGSLRIDPTFSVTTLPADVQLWYARLWTAIRNPNQYLNATESAAENDTYTYGRSLNDHISSLLLVLRVTGDHALLEEVDRLAELMRAQLRDWSILTLGGSTYQADGYLNWVWNYTSGPEYVGTDLHQMDEILTHSLVAAFAWAFEVNRDVDLRFAERADFWRDYLKNHFEAKWRARRRVSTGPFMDKYLTHAYSQWIRYHHYMYLLTGEAWYATEALRKADVVRAQMVTSDGAVVWAHQTTADPRSSATSTMCQPFYYARYTVMAAVDLHMEGFAQFDGAQMPKIATAVRDYVMDNGSTDFAGDICGGVTRAGVPASGYDRETRARYGISGYTPSAAWDASGKALAVAEGVYAGLETASSPRRIFIPAGIVFAKLYR